MRGTGRQKRRIAVGMAILALGLGGAGLGVLAHRRTSPAAPLAEADAAYRRGDWERAARLARSRLDTRSGDPEALRLLARASVRQGDTSRALSIYKGLGDEALEGEDFFVLGLEQHRKRDLTGAADSWQRGVGEGPEPRRDAREARPHAGRARPVHRLDRGRPAAHGPAGLEGPGEPDPGHDLRHDERTRASRRGPQARAGHGGRTRRPGRAWPRPHPAGSLPPPPRPSGRGEGGAWQGLSRGRDARRGITPAARPVRPPGAQASCRRGPRHDPG